MICKHRIMAMLKQSVGHQTVSFVTGNQQANGLLPVHGDVDVVVDAEDKVPWRMMAGWPCHGTDAAKDLPHQSHEF